MDAGRVIRPLQAKLDEVKADGLDVMLCSTEIIENVIFLLKEQEAVEPIPPTDESDLWKCGNCNHQLFRCTHQRYCEMCGRKVKWE